MHPPRRSVLRTPDYWSFMEINAWSRLQSPLTFSAKFMCLPMAEPAASCMPGLKFNQLHHHGSWGTVCLEFYMPDTNSQAVEHQIQEAKKICKSMRQAPDKSIYRQPQTVLELGSKLLLTESILALKTTLVFTKDGKEAVLFPKLFTHTRLPSTFISWLGK